MYTCVCLCIHMNTFKITLNALVDYDYDVRIDTIQHV